VSEFPTRHLTYNYLIGLNSWLLLFPCDLCCDWTMSTVPLVEKWGDARNIATFATFSVLFLLAKTALSNKSDKHSNIVIMVREGLIDINRNKSKTVTVIHPPTLMLTVTKKDYVYLDVGLLVVIKSDFLLLEIQSKQTNSIRWGTMFVFREPTSFMITAAFAFTCLGDPSLSHTLTTVDLDLVE
jgi:hypothetical protein